MEWVQKDRKKKEMAFRSRHKQTQPTKVLLPIHSLFLLFRYPLKGDCQIAVNEQGQIPCYLSAAEPRLQGWAEAWSTTVAGEIKKKTRLVTYQELLWPAGWLVPPATKQKPFRLRQVVLSQFCLLFLSGNFFFFFLFFFKTDVNCSLEDDSTKNPL